MRKDIKILSGLSLAAGLTIALAGCSMTGAETTSDSTEMTVQTTEVTAASENTTEENNTASANDIPEGFSERDFDTSVTDAKSVELSNNATKTDAQGVSVEGNNVTFSQEGTYLLTGELSEGQIIVDLPGENDKIQLVLSGVNITNTGTAGIYVKNADKVFVTTASGSENNISVSGEFVQNDENNVDGAVFSKDDIVFNGEGNLNISSASGHGIVSKNDLKITGGSYDIKSASKSLQGKDMVGIAGGDISLDAGTDGIDSVNVYICGGETDIKAEDEGINADETDENNEPGVTLAGGKINIISGDDGIQTTGDVVNDGADINITAGGGSANAAEHFSDAAFGDMGGWPGKGQAGPMFGGEPDAFGEINFDTDDDETADDGSKNKGIKAANIILGAGNITIDSQDDAIHGDMNVTVSGGTYDIKAGDDGIHADSELTIDGGTFTISAWEGLESTVVTINDGDITISANDDGINAVQKVSDQSPLININGGTVSIDMAQGDTDALDTNGDLKITGGTININAQFAFDFDGEGILSGGTVTVNGEQVTELYNSMMAGPGGMW